MIDRIRAALMWLIGGPFFFLAIVFVLICSYLFKAETYDPWVKRLARTLFRIIGIRVTVIGLDRFDHDATCLFMGNHVNIFDVPLIQGFVPQLVRGVEAERQFKWPIYGWAVRRAGNIPINRKDVQKAIPSANEAVRRLKKGLSMVILPEGHRTRTGEMGPFKKLPFHLAKQSGCPIVPFGFSGLYRIKKRKDWIMRPGRVRLEFGEPIDVETIQQLSVEELRELTRTTIQGLITEP